MEYFFFSSVFFCTEKAQSQNVTRLQGKGFTVFINVLIAEVVVKFQKKNRHSACPPSLFVCLFVFINVICLHRSLRKLSAYRSVFGMRHWGLLCHVSSDVYVPAVSWGSMNRSNVYFYFDRPIHRGGVEQKS